ncbi:Putative uncharacterized protein [Taphrina deformans PYCC 5710]|uniref:Protein cms1 n=1 Tax=Taphrina deformans (strain PYCC 5710 / ATCC 11124 / CBS 356.35 / IMI 108563 / JCM 9778 / NBRC 8474) TaxID=1097556 RepID=R4XAL4_TAPDE|nr:Putative uncharacterized protein [Taphrina deformans PYCC 5710]|eukprot:CCG82833.1 Putative uncharacterized protein [Taphrina deformans PYCC 5710]
MANKRQKVQSADALDDGLDYEVGSDSAGEAEQISSTDDDGDSDVQENDGTEDGDGTASAKVEKVRATKEVTTEERRKKRKLHRASTRARKAEEGVAGDGDSGTVLGVDQQADTVARLVRETYAGTDLSSIELSDATPPTSSFLDTTAFAGPRTLETVLAFMERFSGREQLAVANKAVGRPHTLLLAASAIRVADLCRALAPLKTNQAAVAKLFGKEKRETQTAWLRQNRVNVAVGLPGRTHALLGHAALALDRVEQVYLDASYRDAKKRGMLGIKEVARDLVKLLNAEVLAQRIKSGECKIILF